MNTRLDLLQHLVQTRGVKSYLEIGTGADRTFGQIDVPYKVGVDPERGGTWRGTSDAFFASYFECQYTPRLPPLDLVFVDGLHEAGQALRDVNHALEILNLGGVIVVHDCNPSTEWLQRVPRPLWRLSSGARYERPWTGDVWKAFVQLRCRSDLDCACWGEDYGCGVVLRRENGDRFKVPKDFNCLALKYEEMDPNRQAWLRLMDWEEIVEWVG